MASVIDTLRQIFSTANPNQSPEDLDYKVKSYAQDPAVTDALKDLMPPTPDTQSETSSTPPKTGTSDNLTANPDVASFKIPSANSVQSSFDVNTTPSSVTMNGAMPSMPTGGTTQPNAALPSATPQPITASTPTEASPTTMSVSSTATRPNTPAETIAPSKDESLLASNLSDNDKRQLMLQQESLKRKEGILPILAGGAGDALSTAATAFGTKEGTPVLDKIVGMESKDITQDKQQFEDNLKNDPTSDVSHSYQKVLAMMMGKAPTDPDIIKMSATTIASQLPEVEKFMAKELGLKQIQAQKELSMSMQQGNERDRMWNQAVQTINSVRGDKPLVDSETARNGAISAYNLINQIQSEGRAPNQTEYYDLLGQIWKARNSSAVTNEELQHMDPQTYQSKLGPFATFFTGDPKAIATPAVTTALKNLVIQSGITADQIHDSYMQNRGVNAAATRMQQLYPEDAARLSKMARGLSFADAVKASNANPTMTQVMTATNKSTGARIKSTDGGQTWQPL